MLELLNCQIKIYLEEKIICREIIEDIKRDIGILSNICEYES